MAANGVDCRRGDFPTYFEPGQRASRARRACTARLHIRLQVALACSAKGAQSLGRSAYPLRVARSPLPTAAATAGRAQGRVISTLLHVAELSSMALAGRPLAPSARRRGCAAAAGAVGSAHVAHRVGSALSSLASIFVCVSDAGAPGSQPRVVYPKYAVQIVAIACACIRYLPSHVYAATRCYVGTRTTGPPGFACYL